MLGTHAPFQNISSGEMKVPYKETHLCREFNILVFQPRVTQPNQIEEEVVEGSIRPTKIRNVQSRGGGQGRLGHSRGWIL